MKYLYLLFLLSISSHATLVHTMDNKKDLSPDAHLYFWLKEGKIDTAKKLIKCMEPNTFIFDKIMPSNLRDMTLLQLVTYFGHIDLVRFLIKHGACPNYEGLMKKTPCKIAEEMKHEKLHKILATYDKFLAMKCDNINLVRKLVAEGFDFKVNFLHENRLLTTPLDRAAYCGWNQVRDYLICLAVARLGM